MIEPVVRLQIALGVCMTIGVAAPTTARGDAHGEGEQLFRDAQALLKAGRVAEACATFEGSQRIDPNLATLMNLAACREQNGQLASAWSLFLQVASGARGDPTLGTMSDVAAGRAAVLEPRLSHLIINVPDESRIEGLVVTRNGTPVDPATWNRAIAVDGGRYVIAGKAPDHESWSTTVEVAVERDRQSVDVPRFKEVIGASGPAGPPPAAEVGRGLTGRRKLALGLGAVAVVGLGGGLAFELSGRAAYDDYVAAPAGPGRDDLYDRANLRHHVAQGLAVTGGLAGAAAVVLWLTGARPAAGVAVAPLVAPGVTGVSVAGGF